MMEYHHDRIKNDVCAFCSCDDCLIDDRRSSSFHVFKLSFFSF